MRIHFTGIAGAGMAAAALMMREAGHTITGSDEGAFPPMSTYVEGLGFPVTWAFDAANLADDLDLLVLGASAKLGWQMQDYNVQGAAGNATLATADKGRAVVEAAGRQLALLLQEVAQVPLSTLVARPDLSH